MPRPGKAYADNSALATVPLLKGWQKNRTQPGKAQRSKILDFAGVGVPVNKEARVPGSVRSSASNTMRTSLSGSEAQSKPGGAVGNALVGASWPQFALRMASNMKAVASIPAFSRRAGPAYGSSCCLLPAVLRHHDHQGSSHRLRVVEEFRSQASCSRTAYTSTYTFAVGSDHPPLSPHTPTMQMLLESSIFCT